LFVVYWHFWSNFKLSSKSIHFYYKLFPFNAGKRVPFHAKFNVNNIYFSHILYKITLYNVFFRRVISCSTGKMGPVLEKAMVRITYLSKICRYLNLVKKQRITYRKFTSR
jgi:hypothetical protein